MREDRSDGDRYKQTEVREYRCKEDQSERRPI